MRLAIFLTLIFITSTLAPFASPATTETQFNDGTTSYEHTFTGSGTGTAGVISIPYGAEVTAAEFRLTGEASNTAYTNYTTNAHYGGAGDGNWQSAPPSPFTYGSRSNVDVSSKVMSLKGVPSVNHADLTRTNTVQSLGGAYQNTTGGFIALSDQGYNSPGLKHSDLTVSSSAAWGYMGVVVPISDDEFHVMKYPNQGLYNTPTILRINKSTGAYIGVAGFNNTGLNNGCSSSVNTYMHDATVYNGDVYTVSYNRYALVKWSVTEVDTNNDGNDDNWQWKCSQVWTYGYPNYLTGVDFDDDTGKLYISTYDTSGQYHYVKEVNPASPTSINGSWSMGSYPYNSYGAGLVVNYPMVTYNLYDQQLLKSTHYQYSFNGLWLDSMGQVEIDGGGHYGLVEDGTGKVAFACHYYASYCPSSQSRKINFMGDGDLFDSRSSTTTSATVVGSTFSVSKSLTSLKLTSVLAYEPTGTSVNIDLSNDGGVTWIHANPGQIVTFSNSGANLKWRAHLNGTTSKTPILGDFAIQYTASYQSSGYLYSYQSKGSTVTNLVAATLNWNETRPAGTSISIKYGRDSSHMCTGTSATTFTSPGQTKTISNTGYYLCVRITLQTSNTGVAPSITNLSIQRHSDAPIEPEIIIDNSSVWKRAANAGALIGPVTIYENAQNDPIVKKLNEKIPDTGAGIKHLQIDIGSASSGKLSLDSFSISYIMQTVNLDITIPEGEVLHERVEPYEVVTRHVIGESATSMTSATLELRTNAMAKNPTMTWQNGDVFPEPNDPEDFIEIDSNSWSVENNGILEIHWIFHVTSEFPDQPEVKFKTGCLDNSGSAGFAPIDLMSSTGLKVNRTFGLGWLKVRDNDGGFTSDDVVDNSWVAAGEQIHFQGAMWFADTDDAPKDSAFDVRISRNGWVESTARDTTNQNGSFFITIDLPNIDVPVGMTYEVQTYNEKDPTHTMQPNSDWRRTFKVDATAPERMDIYPKDGDYEAGDNAQEIKVLVNDDVGHPMALKLMYWVEADHDLNRNGEADSNEYASKMVYNNTVAKNKWFMTTIDHSRNANMGRVSYYWDGGDEAGNPLHYTYVNEDDEILIFESETGFAHDDATFRTRKDSSAVFTGLDWMGHEDDAAVYSGMKQTITLGFIDANTAIDFEHISLVFDFEGPNPLRDIQRISYSGINNTFWSESQYLTILQSSNMYETTNDSGLPWIMLTFDFVIGWDWPDEEMGDVALLYKERGGSDDSRILLLEHTFRVENDLMLAPTDFNVNDISEPRTGHIADGSRVRKDDRLAFTGTVVYEGSDVPAPRDVGILVEVFDGEKIWSDGSLTDAGEYSVEVPLSAAETLQSSPTRTCLISITNIPGRGEDMTGALVSTTLRVVVDDASPRVTRRISPLNVIDISANNDLTNIAIEFQGTEDADLTGSQQLVHWVMRDSTRTMTIGAGSALLGMQQDGQNVIWTGTVDLTDSGKITPKSGDFVGFYITGWDAAGNQFPVVSNSEASPIPELASDDNDFERQWIRLGAVGPELRIKSIVLSDDHVAPSSKIDITAEVMNKGGETLAAFKVAFFAGDSETPFKVMTITGIGSGETREVTTTWYAEEVSYVRVEVDYGDLIAEVNDDDNTATHSVDIAYAKYLGGLDSIRENPLQWIFAIVSILVIISVASIASRTSIDYGEGAFDEEESDWEDDEDDYDEEDDDEEDDDEEYTE
jgi:hypothetical protein